MSQGTDTTTHTARELRTFTRVDVPAFSNFSVDLGPLGRPPAESVPVDISRGGLKARTGVTFFEGSEGEECLIRFHDASGRLVPDRALGWVRRVEESRGYYLISIEFTHPLEQVKL